MSKVGHQAAKRSRLLGIGCLIFVISGLGACQSPNLPALPGISRTASPTPTPAADETATAQAVMGNPPGPVLTITPLPGGEFLAGVGPIGNVETDFEWQLYRGKDKSWLRLAWPSEAVPRSLHAAPSGDVLFAVPFSNALYGRGQAWGLMRSTDGGRSWQQALNGLEDPYVMDIAFSPSVLRQEAIPEVRSTDVGPTASATQTVASATRPAATAAATDELTYTLFAVTWYSGVFRSADAGQTWESMSGEGEEIQPSGGANPYDLAVAVSPDYEEAKGQGLVVASFSRALHRWDAGVKHWQTTPLTVTASVKDFDPPGAQLAAGEIAFSPDFAQDKTIYLYSGYAGLFRSTDRGETWQLISRRLDLPPPFVSDFRLAVASADEAYVLIDSETIDLILGQPVRILSRTQDGGKSWKSLRDPPTLGWVSAFALSHDEAGRVVLHLGGSRGGVSSYPANALSWK
jgi:photosystem II stability/assembly factor-like uncharacterized protein